MLFFIVLYCVSYYYLIKTTQMQFHITCNVQEKTRFFKKGLKLSYVFLHINSVKLGPLRKREPYVLLGSYKCEDHWKIECQVFKKESSVDKQVQYLEILPEILPCSQQRFGTMREELETKRKMVKDWERRTEGYHEEENMIYNDQESFA